MMLGFVDSVNFYNGTFWAFLGAAVAFFAAGCGSAKGVGLAGEAGAGVLTEDPKKFGPVMILEALASTQAIYGFVIAFLIIGKVSTDLSFQDGVVLFVAGLPIGIVGFMSGVYQGRVAAAGINMVAKRADGMGRAIILATMVEMFAIIGLIVSLLIVFSVK
ncbi:MAG: V-type ATP synthase subunit K [Clostridiales bacterium]